MLFAPVLRVTSTMLFPTEPAASVSTCTRNSILTHTAPGWTRSLSLPWQARLLFEEPKPAGQGRRQARDRAAGTARPREAHSAPLGAGPDPAAVPSAPSPGSELQRCPGHRGEAGRGSPGRAGAGRRRGNPGQAGWARLTQCGPRPEEEEEEVAEAGPRCLRLCSGRPSVAFRP